ncbi:MAG: hypothetical protein JWL64_601 [Frankiales bacterium]|nr:hypothetical protein [Frankiales bacterium]
MRAVMLLAVVLLLAGCTSDAGAPAASSPGPGVAVPPAPTPRTVPDEGSAAYDGLVVGAVPGELARAGNDTDVSLTTATLTVTVPAGQRLGSRLACEGLTQASVHTDPESGAGSEFACGRDGSPSELVAEADPVAVPTTYAVLVSVPEPARWSAVLYATGG